MLKRQILPELVERSDVSHILHAALNGERPKLNDCINLIRSDDPYAIGIVGGFLRNKIFGNTATFVNNIILNYTNVCITYCKFCAFYRAPGQEDSYTLPIDEIVKRVVTSRELFGISQALVQGGHNPNLGIEYFEEAFKKIKE
ncbi:MAG TPA: radical SAM protein, partial [Nitrososphaeraceae archaeon]